MQNFKDKYFVSAVVPCKNEEKNIGPLIEKLYQVCQEVIVVDNDSDDLTLKDALLTHAKVIYEPRKINGVGYGFAIQRGLKEAQGDFIVVMDGDDTYPVSEIPQIIQKMQSESLDFVSCNRLPLKNKKAISSTRQLGIKILNWGIRILYGKKIKDALTGMWVVKHSVLPLITLKEGGWDLSLEIKLEALSNPKIKFAEYHIDHFERVGESKQRIWQTGFEHFFYILKRRFQGMVFDSRP